LSHFLGRNRIHLGGKGSDWESTITDTIIRPLARPLTHPGALMREILGDHVLLAITEAARWRKRPVA
jgi:hypothetical protein